MSANWRNRRGNSVDVLRNSPRSSASSKRRARTCASRARPSSRSPSPPLHPPTNDHPDVPDHPAYQQILAAFADAGQPMRARDLCQALDLPIVPKNTEGIRSTLKRLVTRGILTDPEPGLFAQPGT
ncbi:hypothetical protein [Streptomyces sp. NPDC059003]|uniref:hypothetical protein n=1 Tax=Streptomyces sp. NPDC059003 TaxID=3346691 RepID=UPI00368F3691